MEGKILWRSKTLWVGLILALAAFVPAVSSFIAANPIVFSAIVSGVFMVLRFVTKGKIVIE
jgi:VIT1/CCC1 family predicted Fe2+/Mn2+ transporter